MTDNVDDFFNRKEKKKTKKTKKTKIVTADDIFKGDDKTTSTDRNNSPSNEEKEDEWIEPVGEPEFVFESVGGMKRLELEERNVQSEGEGEGSDDENAERSWKKTGEPQSRQENVGLPGDNPAPRDAEEEAAQVAAQESTAEVPKKKYVPPSQRSAMPSRSLPSSSAYPAGGVFGRRNKEINVDSVAEFPTLGASVETTPEGFEQVNMRKGGVAWSSGGGSGPQSTGIQNRFQFLENN